MPGVSEMIDGKFSINSLNALFSIEAIAIIISSTFFYLGNIKVFGR